MLGSVNDWTASEILAKVRDMGGAPDPSARMVGLYVEGGLDVANAGLLGVGGEYVSFVGVDRSTGKVVTAHYLGVSFTAGVTIIPGTNVGGGVFSFTGPPSELDGWSMGAQLSAGVTSGVSYPFDGDTVLRISGENITFGVNGGGGYTYRVVVDGQTIYNFGTVKVAEQYDYSFTSDHYDRAMATLVKSPQGEIEIEYSLGNGYTMVQKFQRVPAGNNTYRVNVIEKVVDEDGKEAPPSIASQFASNRIWQFTLSSGEVTDLKSQEHCFLAGTPIAMHDGTVMDIEEITENDLVMSYDAAGNLVPGRVVRTFQNDAKHILDFFGLMVTPGHVMMCGAGRYAGRHVTLLDILRSDGAVVTADGKIIRAATGVEVDSEMDAEIEVVIARQGAKGFEVAQSGRLRMGTRVLLENGTDISLAELIAANGGQRTDAGLITGPQGEAPLMWPFGDQLPAPEDYILARSAVTLADIYAANEWESAPSMHAPVMGDVGPMIPASDRVRDQMPANIPLSMRPRSNRALQ